MFFIFSIQLMFQLFTTGNCVILPVDEYFTSQTCAKCFGRFPRHTRSRRFKVCLNCLPMIQAMLPSVIIAKRGKRDLQMIRRALLANQVVTNGEESYLDLTIRLLSKVNLHLKNWLVNPVTGVLENVNADQQPIELPGGEIGANADANQQPRVLKTVWNRDIVAAKCILIKGNIRLNRIA